jgi:hypothetical protein
VAKDKQHAKRLLAPLVGSDETIRQLNRIAISKPGVHKVESTRFGR